MSTKKKIIIAVIVLVAIGGAAWFFMRKKTLKAYWGIDDKQVDVTEFIKGLSPGTVIPVANETFGIDPAPNIMGKALTIVIDGQATQYPESTSFTK